MKYSTCRDKTLQLIFGYSVAGTKIPAAYNNQADYLAMIPGLLNSGAMEIATTVKPIRALTRLSDLKVEEGDEFDSYTLPRDCWRMDNGGLIGESRGRLFRYGDYTRAGNTILLPHGFGADFRLEYFRYPVLLSPTPADGALLDNTADTHECLPFYAAGKLVLYDDPYRAAILNNEWETRISRLGTDFFVEERPIEDAYGGVRCMV